MVLGEERCNYFFLREENQAKHSQSLETFLMKKLKAVDNCGTTFTHTTCGFLSNMKWSSNYIKQCMDLSFVNPSLVVILSQMYSLVKYDILMKMKRVLLRVWIYNYKGVCRQQRS